MDDSFGTPAPVPAGPLDVILIGGSAGGFTALKTILAAVPGDLPATILVVLHTPAGGGMRVASLLQPCTDLELLTATDGMPLRPGTAVFAPADHHMLLGAHHIHTRHGPRENSFRPAIDPLFRSAAAFRGPRAAAFVLSGLLDDGAAGARALHQTGGLVFVQDPATADYPQMPSAAAAAVPEARVVPLEDIGAAIAAIAGRGRPEGGPVPWRIGVELKIAAVSEAATMFAADRLGALTPYNCPNCNGVLWQIEDGPLVRYRCHVGHAYSAEALAESQEEALERALFEALRAHKGRAALLRSAAGKADSATMRETLEARAAKYDDDACMIERMIRSRGGEQAA